MSTSALASSSFVSPRRPNIMVPDGPGGPRPEPKLDPPSPFRTDRRQIIIHPETGEAVYLDDYQREQEQNKPWICYMA